MERLITLYKDIADLTLEHCKQTCKRMGSCCDPIYCHIAMQTAKEEYGLELQPTGNAILLLDENGSCTAPYHVRQMCSFHSCDINSLGYFKGDPERTEKYFTIRDEIELLEIKRYDEKDHADQKKA